MFHDWYFTVYNSDHNRWSSPYLPSGCFSVASTSTTFPQCGSPYIQVLFEDIPIIVDSRAEPQNDPGVYADNAYVVNLDLANDDVTFVVVEYAH